jgi:hypothetical protein
MTTKVGIEVTEISHDSEAGIEVLNACPWSKNLQRNVTKKRKYGGQL